ncbi:MAG: hypothetical protein IJ272_08545 [Clostridia bacterium]|nr:hypothetical protein [Clostridia bacterium]
MKGILKNARKKILIILLLTLGVNFLPIVNMNVVEAATYIKYDFTEQQIMGLTAICVAENGSSENAIRAEASIMANLFEKNGKKKYGNTTGGFIDYIIKGGWFAKSSTKYYSDPNAKLNKISSKNREKYIAAVKDVLMNGNRYFPAYVDEHDYIGDIVSVSNNGVAFDKKDRSKYKKGVTKIKNTFGATYTFYCFPDSKSDPFGYIKTTTNADSNQSIIIGSNGQISNDLNNEINNGLGGGQVNIAVARPSKGWWGDATDFLSLYKGKNTVIGNTTVESIISFLDPLASLIKTIGNMIFIVVTVILGVTYIWGSVQTKASIKESLMTLVVAALVFYGWNTISALFMSGNQLNFIASTEKETANIIYNTVLYVCNFLAVGGIVYIGLRYLLAGAEGKAELKTQAIPVTLGIILVYATLTFLNLIVGLI